MKKLKVATGVAVLFLVWIIGAGQTTDKSKTKPNLSGVWALDTSKSKINMAGKEKLTDYVLSIVHHEPEIRMTKTYKEDGRERSEETIYYTDGRAEFSSVKGKDSAPTIRWQGNKLVRRSSATPKGAPQTFPPLEIVTTETWELAPDGKTLTRTVKSSGMVTFNARYVFTRTS